jgi:hypothetical protein
MDAEMAVQILSVAAGTSLVALVFAALVVLIVK